MKYKYGEFSQQQISKVKDKLTKKIFFLIIIADPNTKDEHKDIDVNSTFTDLLYEIGGMNSIMGEPPELVTVISFLEMARLSYSPIESQDAFKVSAYRKLILDACSEMNKLKEV